MDSSDKTVTMMSKEFSPNDTMIIVEDSVTKKPESVFGQLSSDDSEATKVDRIAPKYAATETETKFYSKRVKDGRIDHRYEFREQLLSGGMGTIFNVLDLDLSRTTAMKVILPVVKKDHETLDSFIREARITGFLEHPNIIPVHELGCHDDTGLFFTMKLVHGESFSNILDLIEDEDEDYIKKYDEYTILNIFRKICDAVSFAHSKGIIHNDIKPQNVMVGEFGEVLLMDWGIAKYIGDPTKEEDQAKREVLEEMLQYSQSTEKIIQGSPAYMSPEHARGIPADLDETSDIFLLGATLHKILTLEAPYYADNINDVLQLALDRKLEVPQIQNPRIQNPDELLRITLKAMHPKKKKRYKSVDHMINDLEALISGKWSDPKKKTFKKGDHLIKEGETGKEAYLILKGEVEVYKESKEGRLSLDTLGRGAIVGEMSLIAKDKRNASVVALEDTDAAILTKNVLTQNIKKLPLFMAKIIMSMTDRLRIANESRLNPEMNKWDDK